MTTWRERGYVPDSDGEESDGELSTQENDFPILPAYISSNFATNDANEKNGRYDELKSGTKNEKTTTEDSSVLDDEYVDIEDVLDSKPKEKPGDAPRHLAASHLTSGIAVLDLSNLPDNVVGHEDGIELQVRMDIDSGGAPALGDENNSHGRIVSNSPDPLTGEPQPPRVRPAPVNTATTANECKAADASSDTSSPLSSPPSSPPATPPSSVQPPDSVPRPAILGFKVVIPTARRAGSPVPSISSVETASPYNQRSLRQRKPIQMHPYMLEDARYKMQMKAKGVQPVRVQEKQHEDTSMRAAEQDSQDKEYEAPAEEESQDRQRRREKSKSVGQSSAIDRSAARSTEQPLLRQFLGDSTKRRKLGHTYSRKPAALEHNFVHKRGPDLRGGRSNGEGSIHKLQAQREADIYDMPDSPSPSRPAKPQRGQSNDHTASAPADSQTARPLTPRRREMLAFLGEDIESSPIRLFSESSSPPITQRPRQRKVSISSDGSTSRQSRGGSAVSVDSNGSQSENSSNGEDSSQETASQPDGPSKVVNWFKRNGTRGVLPASYIRLAEKSKTATNEHEDVYRRNRQSTTPTSEELRPGVARARVSNRAREVVRDLFPPDEESDSSDDTPIIITEAPAARKRRNNLPTPSVPARTVINLVDDDDIPEDNRIDYGLSAIEQWRTAAPRVRRAAARPAAPKAIKGSGRKRQLGGALTRKKLPKKSSGPRLSVIDAATHLKQATDKSPPRFIKVAARSARARRDHGRQSPARKLFILDTADDTREVQGVLRDWKEDTLPFKRTDRVHQHNLSHPHDSEASADCISSLSPQRISERTNGTTAKRPSLRKPSTTTHPRQTSLFNHDFEIHPVPDQQRSVHPRNPRTAGHFTIAPPRNHVVTHRPAFSPVPAQLERVIPGSQRLKPHPTSRIIDSVIETLHLQRLQRRPRPDEHRTGAGRSGPKGYIQPRPLEVPLAQPSDDDPFLPAVPNRRLRRKNIPQRVDADTIERRQPPAQDLAVRDDLFAEKLVVGSAPEDQLSGLLPSGSKYSLHFDTPPVRDGAIFNSETFIGKGHLAEALDTPFARVTITRHGESFHFLDNAFHWGVFEDSVATEFEVAMGQIADLAENRIDRGTRSGVEGELFAYQAYSFYGFITRYISKVLSFHDPLDVVPFAQRFLQTIESCCDRLPFDVSGPSDAANITRSTTRLGLQTNAFCLVAVWQIFRLTSANADIQEQLELPRLFRKLGHQLLGRLLRCGIDRIRNCYEDQRHRTKYERGISSEHYLAELWILAVKTLDDPGLRGVSFWEILNDELHMEGVEQSGEVPAFERLWRTLFSLLPLFQFDNFGVARRIDDNRPVSENWALVRVLAGRPLRVYDRNKGKHSGSINDYLRVLHFRCYHLITKWGWQNPDTIIPVLFELFASNGLANLPNEDDRGSPNFLLNLDSKPIVEVDSSDRCFVLLLKIIVVGIRRMKSTATHRRISGLVYRLLPNHRRRYPKDEELRLEHLAALRNHHYLLETLYWAAPPECRPPLDAIRLLVDPATSHREACNVAVRAWSNLMRFQLHSNEGVESLKHLMEWFDDLAIKTLVQHHLVRNEAEVQFRLARDNRESDLLEDDMEDNIRRNQKQLEGILNDLVISLSQLLASIPGQIPSAVALLSKAATANILDSSTRLSNRLLLEVLSLLRQFMKTCNIDGGAQLSVNEQGSNNDDSQDYGDWTGFEEIAMQDETKQAANHFHSAAYPSLHRLLSNCFGADRQPEESLLLKLVDTWTMTAKFLVQHRIKQWDMFLTYSQDAWSSLRDTPQQQKYIAYFMPKVIECKNDIYQNNRPTFLGFWIRSLVERESMLKFQNEFTATLLNYDSANPILSNLPFARDTVSGVFNMTPSEFRMRRLSLISSVLAQMRSTFKAASGHEAMMLKQEYAEMLRAMMNSMKKNFEALHSSAVSGAYVDFVHTVVEYLLQYATEIVEIDKFFTDSSAFPLPAMDPNYVVGQLKKYDFRLAFPGSQKQLNAFFQTLCERAALNNEQENLVKQLSTALSADLEDGDANKPTMRGYFLHAIFPVYLEAAFSHPAGWVLGVPVLRALAPVLSGLRASMDSTNFLCIESVLSMLTTILNSVRIAANHAMAANNTFTTPHLLGTLTLLLDCLAAAIPIVSFVGEFSPPFTTAKECTDYLLRFTCYARKLVFPRPSEEAERPLDILTMSERPANQFSSSGQHCAENLWTYLTRRWQAGNDGEWFVMEGNNRRSMSLPVYPGEDGRVKECFSIAAEECMKIAARTEEFQGVVRDVDLQVWEWEWRRRQPYSERVEDGRGNAMGFLGEVFC